MKNSTKPLAILSSLLFLIGSLYYSYVHIRSAHYSMCRITYTNDGYAAKFNISNINILAILSVFIIIAILTISGLLIAFSLKNKHRVLS